MKESEFFSSMTGVFIVGGFITALLLLIYDYTLITRILEQDRETYGEFWFWTKVVISIVIGLLIGFALLSITYELTPGIRINGFPFPSAILSVEKDSDAWAAVLWGLLMNIFYGFLISFAFIENFWLQGLALGLIVAFSGSRVSSEIKK